MDGRVAAEASLAVQLLKMENIMRVLRLQNKKYTCYMPFVKEPQAQRYMANMTRTANYELKGATMTVQSIIDAGVFRKSVKYGEVYSRLVKS